MKTIGVFGSAFNPPTLGHANVIKQVVPIFDAIWLVPAHIHPWNKKMMPYVKRCDLTQIFIDCLKIPKIQSMFIEDKINVNAPIFSELLLQTFSEHHPNHQFSLIIGPDNARNFHKFHNAAHILSNWSVHIVSEEVNIRSTLIRTRLKENKSVESLVYPEIAAELKKMNYLKYLLSS